jgi:hypothetical protein
VMGRNTSTAPLHFSSRAIRPLISRAPHPALRATLPIEGRESTLRFTGILA